MLFNQNVPLEQLPRQSVIKITSCLEYMKMLSSPGGNLAETWEFHKRLFEIFAVIKSELSHIDPDKKNNFVRILTKAYNGDVRVDFITSYAFEGDVSGIQNIINGINADNGKAVFETMKWR